MKKKYYYDCPIQALYMHVNFGVKFSIKVYLQAELWTDNDFKNMTPDTTKIYVKPESEYIFESKDYDSGIYNGELWTFIAGQWVLSSDYEHRTESDDFIKNIVKRDNKHFFNPKEEN